MRQFNDALTFFAMYVDWHEFDTFEQHLLWFVYDMFIPYEIC